MQESESGGDPKEGEGERGGVRVLYVQDGDFLLLKVTPVFLVDEDEVEVVAGAKLFVHVPEGGGEFKAAEEEADGDGLAADGGAVHDFKLGDGLALVVLVGRGAGGFAADDGELHVLDLDADEEKVDLADNHVLEVVLGLVVLKLNVQTVFDAHLHLDGVVRVRRHAVAVYPQIALLGHVRKTP